MIKVGDTVEAIMSESEIVEGDTAEVLNISGCASRDSDISDYNSCNQCPGRITIRLKTGKTFVRQCFGYNKYLWKTINVKITSWRDVICQPLK
jgi:hypothetical protein